MAGRPAILREMHSPFAFAAGEADDFLAAIRTALATDWPSASQASRRLAARYGTWPDAIGRLVDTYERILREDPCADRLSSCRCTT